MEGRAAGTVWRKEQQLGLVWLPSNPTRLTLTDEIGVELVNPSIGSALNALLFYLELVSFA